MIIRQFVTARNDFYISFYKYSKYENYKNTSHMSLLYRAPAVIAELLCIN